MVILFDGIFLLQQLIILPHKLTSHIVLKKGSLYEKYPSLANIVHSNHLHSKTCITKPL